MAKKNAKKTRQAVPPTCSCLVFCDDVIVSHGLGKHQLMGIIGTMHCIGEPGMVSGGVVYARLSNVHSHQKVTVEFYLADDHEKMCWKLDAQLVNPNEPLDVHTVVARVPPFGVPKAGRYILEAQHNGIPIASVPITIKALQPAGPGIESLGERGNQ